MATPESAMDRDSLNTVVGLVLLVIGGTLVGPQERTAGPRAPRQAILDYQSVHGQLCVAVNVAAIAAIEELDFDGYRVWQSPVTASRLAATTDSCLLPARNAQTNGGRILERGSLRHYNARGFPSW